MDSPRLIFQPSKSSHVLWMPNMSCLTSPWMGLLFKPAHTVGLFCILSHTLEVIGKLGRKGWKCSLKFVGSEAQWWMLSSAQKWKRKTSEQRGKCFYLPNYLEGKCKHKPGKPRLPSGGLKGLGTYRVRKQHHVLLGHGRPKILRGKEREQECVSQ